VKPTLCACELLAFLPLTAANRQCTYQKPPAQKTLVSRLGLRCLQCKVVDFPSGCVSVFKMVSFLEGKWIPGFESTSNPRFVEPGKYMAVERAAPSHHQLKSVPGYVPGKPHKVGQVRTPTSPRLMCESDLPTVLAFPPFSSAMAGFRMDGTRGEWPVGLGFAVYDLS